MAERRTIELDSRSLRALAHPLRFRLLGALRTFGPATATTLAQALDTNSGATSYHLRQLAAVGLVEDDPEHSSGRDRRWRAAHKTTRWSSSNFMDDPDDRAANTWLVAQQARTSQEAVNGWLETYHLQPREWTVASTMSDWRLDLTADQVAALNDELEAVINRYDTTEAPDGARSVRIHLQMFPESDVSPPTEEGPADAHA